MATLACATVGVVVTSAARARVFSVRARRRGSSAGTREVSRHGADGGGAGASRDARRRERARAFSVDSTSVKTRSRWRFPPGRARPPRWSRGDRIASTFPIPPPDSRCARYAVHVSCGPVLSPELAVTRGALKTGSSAPSIAHLAHPRSQDAAPSPPVRAKRFRTNLPEAETARCGSARTHRAGQDRQDLAQGARATTSRAPPSSFSSKRINPFRCRSIARP